MTREDIECIIKWFSHIEQLATDGKTANGFQMPPDKILATIKVVAKDSREYIEKFCNDSVPNDLEEAAWEYAPDLPSYNIGGGYLPPQSRDDLRIAFKDGAKWDREQMMKDLSEKIAAAYQLGLADKEKQIMSEAVEGKVAGDGEHCWIDADVPMSWLYQDKVRIIIVKED